MLEGIEGKKKKKGGGGKQCWCHEDLGRKYTVWRTIFELESTIGRWLRNDSRNKLIRSIIFHVRPEEGQTDICLVWPRRPLSPLPPFRLSVTYNGTW